MEILAPLGKLEYLDKIIESGADAVYAGVSGLSSRPESADLSIEEFKQAIRYAHSKGCKVYAALNACIPQRKISDAVLIAEKLDRMGADAIILAEYGIIPILAEQLNHSKIHASTLLGVYNSETIELLKRYGVSRIVLSSDMFIDEMAELIRRNNDVEYEIIAAGGICYQCNRQCRLPHGIWNGQYHVACQNQYELLEEGEKVGVAHKIGAPSVRLYTALGLYCAMGISSFKIEGRTNRSEDVCQRIDELNGARGFLNTRQKEMAGYLHYVSRYLEGLKC